MIELKEALNIAKQFIIEMSGEKSDFQIEEVALSDDKKNWQVTYSYSEKIENPNSLQSALGLEKRRLYKRIVIDAENKDVIGMYNWSFTNREAA